MVDEGYDPDQTMMTMNSKDPEANSYADETMTNISKTNSNLQMTHISHQQSSSQVITSEQNAINKTNLIKKNPNEESKQAD